ncbi:MAG: hypothetical protein SVK44_07985 [Nitrospirota bacterium]|nr:hypothetical protein [Nitrospirota bacterium]
MGGGLDWLGLYSSPTYSIDNISQNLLGVLPIFLQLGSGWVQGISAIPQTFTITFSTLSRTLEQLPGGIDYLSWLIPQFLNIFVPVF